MIKSNKNLINKIVIAVAEYFCSVCHAINCARHMSRVNFILHQKNCCVWRSQCVQNLVSITVIIHWNGELLANCLVDYWKKRSHTSQQISFPKYTRSQRHAHTHTTHRTGTLKAGKKPAATLNILLTLGHLTYHPS